MSFGKSLSFQPYILNLPMRIFAACLLFGSVLLFSCTKDDEPTLPDNPHPVDPVDTTTTSPVVFDPAEVPYPNLSDYNFYEGPLADMKPVEGVLPYELNSSLFSDYAHKKRFVWMPEGVSAEYDGDEVVLNFDNGAVLIKNFYYDNVSPNNARRIIETRLLYKIDGDWHFADYIWNDEQTEATFSLEGGQTLVNWIDENGESRTVDYRIPSSAECLTCHKTNSLPVPIGPKPQNLNKSIPYVSGILNQLEKWQEMGYIRGEIPVNINTTVAWDDPTALLLDRVRSYLDINCAHCHKEESHCDYRPMRFAFSETHDPTNIGVCVPPDETLSPQLTNIIAPGNIERSMMHFRMSSTNPANRMPLLGRSIVHDEAVDMIVTYINSLEPC